jgi:hypothetical protein
MACVTSFSAPVTIVTVRVSTDFNILTSKVRETGTCLRGLLVSDVTCLCMSQKLIVSVCSEVCVYPAVTLVPTRLEYGKVILFGLREQ